MHPENTMAGSSLSSTISLRMKLILTGQVSDIVGKQSHLEDVSHKLITKQGALHSHYYTQYSTHHYSVLHTHRYYKLSY